MIVLLKQLLQKNSSQVVSIRQCANKLYNLHLLFKPLTGRQILPFNTVFLLLDNKSCYSGKKQSKKEKKLT